MKPIFAAGILYQNLPLNADITFEAGTLDMVLGEEQNLSGMDGAPGIDWRALGYLNGIRLATAPPSEVNGVAWNRI